MPAKLLHIAAVACWMVVQLLQPTELTGPAPCTRCEIISATTEGIQVDYNTTTVVCTAHTNPASPVHIGVYSNDHEILPDNPSRQEGVALITVSPPNSCQPVNSSEGCEEIKILVEHGEVRKDTQLQFHCSFTVWTFPCDQCDSPVFNLSILAPTIGSSTFAATRTPTPTPTSANQGTSTAAVYTELPEASSKPKAEHKKADEPLVAITLGICIPVIVITLTLVIIFLTILYKIRSKLQINSQV